MPVTCVFFDVGDTLGTVSLQFRLCPYPDTLELLTGLRALGLRLGVISNVPIGMMSSDLTALLATADLHGLFDPTLIVASKGGPDAKPAPAIYLRAAASAGVAIGSCLFVGEDLVEVIGARAAGMAAQHKPRPI